MSTDKAIKAGAALLLIVVAGMFFFRQSATKAENADFPEGTFWVCTQPDCGHEFVMSTAEVARHFNENPGTPMPCPKCKAEAVRAFRCSACEKFFPRPGRGSSDFSCPHCGHDLRDRGGS